MIEIISLAAIGAVGLILTEPYEIEASAHLPKNRIFDFRKPILSFTKDVIVNVRGNSAVHLGISHGDILKARILDASGRNELKAGDIVVIKSKTDNADNPHRIRQIKKIANGRVTFNCPPDFQHPDLKERDLCVIFAKVTHIHKDKVALAA